MIIELPDWARIGETILVKDVRCDRGDNPNSWYEEEIVSFGYDGIFHQTEDSPEYFTKFSEWGKTIKEIK